MLPFIGRKDIIMKDIVDGYTRVIQQIESKYTLDCSTYLVHIMYKYSHENKFRNEYEIFDYTPDGVIWLNDWWEGEQDIIVKGYINLDEIPPTLLHEIT